MKAILIWVTIAWLAGPAQAGVAPAAPQLVLELVADNLNQPLAARHAGDGSGRLFVIERPGLIRIIAANGQLLETPFLDIATPGLTNTAGEGGLLGLDFHPDFETNGLFFLNYTSAAPGLEGCPGSNGGSNRCVDNTVIARFSVSDTDPNIADPDSGVEIMTIRQDFSNHNGGDIHFGPDGFLYIGMGDGGSGGDPNDRAQDPQSLLGKMLRIDVDNEGVNSATACGDDLGGPSLYAIPGNNPFAGDDGICDEIWALGLRNPYRFSFDRNTGDLFIADVGQNAFEEVSFQPASSTGGENYGWDCREGQSDFASPSMLCTTNPPTVTEPILVYEHIGGGRSITGGYRYRGGLASAQGLYFYADFSRRDYFVGFDTGAGWSALQISRPYLDTDGNSVDPRPSAFGEDEAGNLYVVDINGSVYRFGELVFAGDFEE